MERDDVRIASVLRELADLGRRIGERAGELARLTAERHQTSATPPQDDVAMVAARAADLASGAAAVAEAGDRVETRAADSSRSPVPPTSRKTSTKPHERTAPTSSRRPAGAPAAGRDSRGTGSRPGVVRRSKPQRLRAARHAHVFGPGLASGAVHLIALLGLAMMYVKVKAEPARVAITLGEAVELGEPIENVNEEITLVAADDPQQADELMESFTVVEPTAQEPFSDPGTSLEELFADVQSADGTVMTDTALFDSGDMLAELTEGGQGGGGQRGGGHGAGGAADRTAPTFFGRAGKGRSVCFICDNSNSYRDGSFHAVLDELSRAVDLLRPEQSFFVIFSSDAAYPLFHPAGADVLQPATVENKQKLRAWLRTVEMCSGGQGIHDAVRLAGGLGADCVYLLSDGELGATVVDRLEAADFGGAVVHTFGVQQSVIDRRTGQVDPDRLREQQGRNQNLITISTAHGGTFTSVAVPPAVAALEKMRPIPRNRSRGAVWGVKL